MNRWISKKADPLYDHLRNSKVKHEIIKLMLTTLL